jgi:hypothetical protein
VIVLLSGVLEIDRLAGDEAGDDELLVCDTNNEDVVDLVELKIIDVDDFVEEVGAFA